MQVMSAHTLHTLCCHNTRCHPQRCTHLHLPKDEANVAVGPLNERVHGGVCHFQALCARNFRYALGNLHLGRTPVGAMTNSTPTAHSNKVDNGTL